MSECKIDFDGAIRWYKNEILHRDDDEPAVIYPDRTYKWFKNGKEYSPA
jgi:hypothetical protein